MAEQGFIKEFNYSPKVPALGDKVNVTWEVSKGDFVVQIQINGSIEKQWSVRFPDDSFKTSGAYTFQLKEESALLELRVLNCNEIFDTKKLKVATFDQVIIKKAEVLNVRLEDKIQEVEFAWEVENARDIELVIAGKKEILLENRGRKKFKINIGDAIRLLAIGYSDKKLSKEVPIPSNISQIPPISPPEGPEPEKEGPAMPKVQATAFRGPTAPVKEVGTTPYKVFPPPAPPSSNGKKSIVLALIGVLSVIFLIGRFSKSNDGMPGIENGIEGSISGESNGRTETNRSGTPSQNQIIVVKNNLKMGQHFEEMGDHERAVQSFTEAMSYDIDLPEMNELAKKYRKEAEQRCEDFKITNTPILNAFANYYFEYAAILAKSPKGICE